MLIETLKWRKVMKPQDIRAAHIEFEATTGKTRMGGLDRWGRPVIILIITHITLILAKMIP
jgi:hypothetical protein